MLNQIVLVGRLTKNPIIEEGEIKRTNIELAVLRSFKNENGEYETDFIPVVLLGNIGNATCEYCRQGDLIGIKGRIQTNENNIEIVAEKVTFLSSKPKKD